MNDDSKKEHEGSDAGTRLCRSICGKGASMGVDEAEGNEGRALRLLSSCAIAKGETGKGELV